jgi:hypothetical protein
MSHEALTADHESVRRAAVTPALWRVAGGLAIAHVVLLFAGFSQEKSPAHGDSADRVARLFGDADFTRVIAGGYVESLSFVVLLPALVFVARQVGQRTEIGRWASMTGLAAGIGYVTATLAAGMPAGAAALYAAQHGADPTVVAAVVDVRNYAFFLSILLCGGQALAVGVAALADGRFTRWLGWGGLVAGTLSIVGVAAQFVNIASMLWIIWWVGVGITLIRYPRRNAS